jgi:hypothetical protein
MSAADTDQHPPRSPAVACLAQTAFAQQAVSGQPTAECWSSPRRRQPVGLCVPSGGVGGQPSQFLSVRAEAERAFPLAERLAASGTGETPSSAGPFFSKGDFVTEPRDLTDLVPADVRTELAAVVAALELHGPAVTKALQRLDQATTAAWNAVHPVDPTQDEWRLVERAVGYRPWLECRLPAGLHPRPAWAGPLTNLTPDGSQLHA